MVQSTKDLKKKKDDLTFASSGTAMPAGPQDMGATMHIEIETERDRDAQALDEKKKLEGN
jgi:hypothetical protein